MGCFSSTRKGARTRHDRHAIGFIGGGVLSPKRSRIPNRQGGKDSRLRIPPIWSRTPFPNRRSESCRTGDRVGLDLHLLDFLSRVLNIPDYRVNRILERLSLTVKVDSENTTARTWRCVVAALFEQSIGDFFRQFERYLQHQAELALTHLCFSRRRYVCGQRSTARRMSFA